MPELPEVQTIVTELTACLPGKKITAIREFYPGTVRSGKISAAKPIAVFFRQKNQGIITSVGRRGKYIVLNLTGEIVIIIHLRMTGKLILECRADENNPPQDNRHIRAVIDFNDGSHLLFNDVRTFGKIDILPKSCPEAQFTKLGCEPLSEEFCSEYLSNALAKRTISIKKALLDQTVIAGIGNIYANEILHRSRIDPFKKVDSLTPKEIDTIIKKTKEVLEQAIECNGTTISDYRRVDDKQGTFQDFLQVYGKDNCPQNHPVVRVKADGRSTFYCPKCQK